MVYYLFALLTQCRAEAGEKVWSSAGEEGWDLFCPSAGDIVEVEFWRKGRSPGDWRREKERRKRKVVVIGERIVARDGQYNCWDQQRETKDGKDPKDGKEAAKNGRR